MIRSLLALMLGAALGGRAYATPLPAPAFDPPDNAATATALLSGGCFWGMQGVFEHVKGVRRVYAGYTGGAADTATYEQVSTGTTGHAESVEILFDPRVISYGTILRVYFSDATDPTELDFQGPDQGPQYRGEIWVENPAQRQVAAAYVAQLTQAHVFNAPIVTRIDPAGPFYQAEGYHQDFMVRHPDYPYIVINDAPKLAALRVDFPALYRADPVRVTP
ncbi:peptide-methionine (S)-S-oxide reductase MsrA [Acidocella sp.]|uniref:peptide-methionine (S)-S-oxide reductase MsrA n=1 Tax=Acidocella sp. TaxID=50710 RepID=UPI002621FC77|nr:peptide-methionine (S)-S-oxide reductase MsrA [Acidocella sp.]